MATWAYKVTKLKSAQLDHGPGKETSLVKIGQRFRQDMLSDRQADGQTGRQDTVSDYKGHLAARRSNNTDTDPRSGWLRAVSSAVR